MYFNPVLITAASVAALNALVKQMTGMRYYLGIALLLLDFTSLFSISRSLIASAFYLSKSSIKYE